MSLAEGVSARLAYKFHTSGAMTTNALDVPGTGPGATGGQVLRRVSATPSLKKATYQSQEIRTDRQIYDFRHGVGHVEGSINGELSPASYFDFFEAVHRDTKVGPVSVDHTTLTSVAFDSGASTCTFGGGNPVTAGLFVGDVIRFSGLTTATANNAVNFTILGFSGGSNVTLLLDPAPTTGTADTGFSLSRPGHATIAPLTGHISRKMLLEVYHADLDIARLYQECRLGSYKISVPASGMATCEFSLMGRAASSLSAGAAPFFTSPTAAATTGVVAAVNGALLINGVKSGVITAFDVMNNLNPSQADVVGQNFPAEVFLGRENVTGNFTAFLTDNVLINAFDAETEIAVLLRMTTGSDPESPVISMYLPRVKEGGADVNLSGEAGQTIAIPFQALLSGSTTPGVPATTIRIVDSEA